MQLHSPNGINHSGRDDTATAKWRVVPQEAEKITSDYIFI